MAFLMVSFLYIILACRQMLGKKLFTIQLVSIASLCFCNFIVNYFNYLMLNGFLSI